MGEKMVQNQMNMQKSWRHIVAVVLLVGALISAFGVSKVVSAPEFFADEIDSLDEKKMTVMQLAAAAAASSTALSLLPGDIATPIANQIAELSTYFIFILGAILLEKILLSVVGYLAFTYMVPLACLLGILFVYLKRPVFLNLAVKLAIFGVVLFLTIPMSIQLSDLIYESYEQTIDRTIETVEENNEAIEETKSELAEEDKNWLEKFGDYVSDVTSKIGADIQGIVKKGENSLAAFMDAVATMLVIACVIPVVVIVIFAFVIKLMFSFDSAQWVRGFSKGDGHDCI